MFALQSATDQCQISGMSPIGGSRPTISDLLRAAGGAPAPPSLISSINATNQAACALLASKLTAEQKAYVASRMGAIDPFGSRVMALAKLQAGQRLIEQARQTLNLDAAFRSQVAASTLAAAESAARVQGQRTNPTPPEAIPTPPQAAQAPVGAASTPAFKKDVRALQNIPKQDGKGNFPVRLHAMLSDLEEIPGGSDVASFLPHGRAFAIHKPREFVRYVMPKVRVFACQGQLRLYVFYSHSRLFTRLPLLTIVFQDGPLLKLPETA
jgi:hypothetical protein